MAHGHRSIQRERQNMLGGIWNWFFQNNWGSGPKVDTRSYCQKVRPHVHQWQFYTTIRNGWRVENGRPVGERVGITVAMLDVVKNSNKTETKISQLRDWKNSGYEFVHTSQTMYKCKHLGCDVIKSVEHYAAPVKGDGSGPMVAGHDGSFQKTFVNQNGKTTTIINNGSYKREIAVEPMKRHGVRSKPKQPPVVAMES